MSRTVAPNIFARKRRLIDSGRTGPGVTPPDLPPGTVVVNGRLHVLSNASSGTDPACTSQPTVETPLSADEVESYPCPTCPTGMVFLTLLGLRRHAAACHPQKINEIVEFGESIESTWRKRRAARSSDCNKHSAAAATAAGTSGDRFKNCEQCGVLVDHTMSHVAEGHAAAHSHNQKLKQRLLQQHGIEHVKARTCIHCDLVFTSDDSLRIHLNSVHRDRLVDGNSASKASAAGRPPPAKTSNRQVILGTNVSAHLLAASQPSSEQSSSDASKAGAAPGLDDANTHAAAGDGANEAAAASSSAPSGNDDMLCRTSCEECGLQMARPCLLVRHMMRAHSRGKFLATIRTKGVAPFEMFVDYGTVHYRCCGRAFWNRFSLLSHRRAKHSLLPNGEHSAAPSASRTVKLIQRLGNNTERTLEGRLVPSSNGEYEVLVLSSLDADDGEIFMVEEEGTASQQSGAIEK